MNTRFLLAILIASPLVGTAQTNALSQYVATNLSSGYALVPPDVNLMRGIPFVVPSWQQANLLLNGNSSSLTVPLKYDAYRQELRVKRTQGDSVVVPLAQVREFTLTQLGRHFVCYPIATLPADVNGACAEVLTDGPHIQLLKFWRKDLVNRPVDNGSYASGSTMNVLEEQVHYYLRWPGDGHFTPLKLKKASLEQALAGQPAALAALKTRKGSLSSEADFAAAMAAVDPVLTTPAK